MGGYIELLKDPRWQRKRLEILQRDGFACQKCYDKENTLHVHHTYYDKTIYPWDYPEDSLITLCEDCHKEETKNLPIYARDFIEELKKNGFMADDFLLLTSAIDGNGGFGYGREAISETMNYFFYNDKFKDKCFALMIQMKESDFKKRKT